MGRSDDASLHFEEAVAICRKGDYRTELAWSLHDYAYMLIQRNDAGDPSKARALLDEADRIASDLGMKPLNAKAAALRELLDTRPSPKPAYPDGLTQREVEVLRLVAAGSTNREIAEKLVLSIRTVERHIANTYSKIGAHGRADATAYALKQKLATYD